MPFPPAVAEAIASLTLSAEARDRIGQVSFRDAGHGFDTFGMHPSFVAFGASILGPLYDRYFRTTSHGASKIPDSGPTILAANHSGNLPIDGAMLYVDVLRKTDPPRVARPIADHFVPALPFVGTAFARGGMVGGSRGNARALLEAGECLMIFPEGVPGIVKPFSERYQLQSFRVGHAELAIRHSAQIVPVGIVGGEEQMPALLSSRRLGRLIGIPAMPIPIVPLPLPVRYHIYYGDPIRLDLETTPDQADDPSVVREAADHVQAAVHDLIQRGLSERNGVFG
jgi:1-acyl-sn-glycerol-3-phosphate acyltransferase